MHTLGCMVAKNDPPIANLTATEGIIKQWTRIDYPSEEAFLDKGIPQAGSCVKLLQAMAEWCLALHAAWRENQAT